MALSRDSSKELAAGGLAVIADQAYQLAQGLNRSDPIGEAQFAAAEVLHHLTSLPRGSLSMRVQAVQDALGAARAAVGALGFALVELRSSAQSPREQAAPRIHDLVS
jgi:hypothetical protein